MKLSSPAFPSDGQIPTRYTCDGADLSPPLAWSDAALGVQRFALIADDPDAPGGTWAHWVVLEDGARQGMTDFRTVGYGEPCPPSGAHRYFFHLYALDTKLELLSSSSKKDLGQAMQGHVLQHAVLLGIYRYRS